MDISLLFPILILLLFIPIFLSGRRQKRQMQKMQQMQAALEAGDVVVTTSGLRATVVDAFSYNYPTAVVEPAALKGM